jgi:hypothetical protein
VKQSVGCVMHLMFIVSFDYIERPSQVLDLDSLFVGVLCNGHLRSPRDTVLK